MYLETYVCFDMMMALNHECGWYCQVGFGEDAPGYYIEQNDKFDGPSFPVYFDDLGPDPGNIDMTGVTLKGTIV